MSRNSPINQKVRARIKALRGTHGLTQAELAERSGVDYKHIQLLEGKTAPSVRLDTLEKICLGFALKLHEFFDDPVFTHADRIAISGKTKTARK
ncbi:helix-turn-helix transcriptional regulator [Turneriella parva]|uniref:helix-turn-helix transcriptional regulator n=1 Tax=Turneriella parva TaxID=29510 RepID=UPI0005A50FC0|nr:helix-turn-helix transcriptional regulator [Turneriella parva]